MRLDRALAEMPSWTALSSASPHCIMLERMIMTSYLEKWCNSVSSKWIVSSLTVGQWSLAFRRKGETR